MPSCTKFAHLLAFAALAMPGLVARGQEPPPATKPAPPTAPTVPAAPAATEPSAATNAQAASQAEPAKPSTDPVERIKEEATKRSQVMATLSYLTDVIGPRLTASPAMKRANDWTKDKLASWGLENAHLEAWGPFGKGWTLQRYSMQVVEPQCIPLIAFPRAWSPGTNGTVTGDVVDLDSVKEADLDKLKGKLSGAFVLVGAPREVEAHFEPLGTRLSEKDLLELANAAEASPRRPRRQLTPEQRAAAQLQRKKMIFAMEEGAAAVLEASRDGDGGTLFVAQASVPSAPQPPDEGPPPPGFRRVSAWDKDAPRFLPQITVSKEHYNRLLRMVRQGEKLKVALDLAVQFHDDAPAFNTVAEIPGTDLKDEVVMLGGHMDSWHSATGATDNAAGVSVALEVVRILKALDLKPRRTIRVALWSGEEQGLFGSRAYVKEHFGQVGDGSSNSWMGGGGGEGAGNAQPPKVTPKPDYEKFSAYFNLDNGTGKVRGIYLQGNEAARGIFRPWLTPFKYQGASTITLLNTGGTDHLSFDGIGLPGFQFIQDVVEYDSRTHHSNQDLYDRIQADDMKQAAAIMATFVYNTAMRDEKIPRKPVQIVPPGSSPTPTTPPATTTTTSTSAAAR